MDLIGHFLLYVNVYININYIFVYNNMNTILSQIGKLGPLILAFTSTYFLWGKTYILSFYWIGIVFNILFNFIVKGILKQSRPNIDKKVFNLAQKNHRRFIKYDGQYIDIYGMPSGHSQQVFFSLLHYFFFINNSIWITIFYIFIAFLTAIERVIDNYHTINQVLVGSIIGLIIAYLIHYAITEHLKGKLTPKDDDNSLVK